jgi:pimeloyl-ACP methyl ester carboxylesterase
MYQAMQRYLDNRDEFEAVWNVVDTFDMRDRLADIVVPVLIVSPADSSQAAGQARRMNREIPHSERVVVADAGHMVMMDNPDGFNSELRAFLRRLGEEAP